MRHRLLTAVALFASAAASAETAYVTGNLRLGLHAASDTSDRPFESLLSGTPMEVLERRTNYARVRLADGSLGAPLRAGQLHRAGARRNDAGA